MLVYELGGRAQAGSDLLTFRLQSIGYLSRLVVPEVSAVAEPAATIMPTAPSATKSFLVTTMPPDLMISGYHAIVFNCNRIPARYYGKASMCPAAGTCLRHSGKHPRAKLVHFTAL